MATENAPTTDEQAAAEAARAEQAAVPATAEEAAAILAKAAELEAEKAVNAPAAPEAAAAPVEDTFELRSDSTGRQFKIHADGRIEVLESPSGLR